MTNLEKVVRRRGLVPFQHYSRRIVVSLEPGDILWKAPGRLTGCRSRPSLSRCASGKPTPGGGRRPERKKLARDAMKSIHSAMDVQLELLAPWYAQRPEDSHTLDLFDAVPKYPFATTRFVDQAERIAVDFKFAGKCYRAEILPAQIKDPATGRERLVFPGGREELVERALRYLAVQQIAKVMLTPDGKRHSVTVFFTLSMIRRHLETLGHGFMLSEIKEALEILSGTMMEIFLLDGDAAQQPRRTRTRSIKGTILTSYTKDFSEEDETGEASLVAMTFHQLVTAAILQMAYYPINALRVGKLKSTLARWLTTRMSHNYRQARKNGWIDGDGYHISLETILAERGLVKENRLRANVESVRAALVEMKKEKILFQQKPYDEKLTLATARGGRKIVGAVWTLYPSPEFVEEIIRGNEQMAENKQLGQAGGPELWDSTS